MSDDAASMTSMDMPSFGDMDKSQQDEKEAALAGTVVPECVSMNEETANEYEEHLKKAGELLSMDQAALARERRWAIAEEKLQSSTMISPNSVFRIRWDIVQVLFLTYVAIFVPYRIGFSQDSAPGDAAFAFDVVIDLYFLIDIGLSFRTGFVDSRGELQYKTGVLSKNYASGWMSIDVMSCLPVNYVGLLPGMQVDASTARSNKMLRLLRLLRLLKLLRLMRINRIVSRFHLSDGFEAEFHALLTAMKLLKLMLLILGLAHWLGCAWYYCGDIESESTHPDGTRIIGWVEKKYSNQSFAQDYTTRYMNSLYWSIMTMTTVGYGNISASTIYEVVCSIVGMMGGGFIFGAIVGNLSEFSRRANPGKNLESKRTGLLRAFMVERGVTARLMKRVNLWYIGHLGQRTAMETEEQLLQIPTSLRDELLVELGYATGKCKSDAVQYSLVHKVPFLSGLDNVSLTMVCLKLNYEKFQFSPTDETVEAENRSTTANQLMIEGTPAKWMTIMTEGRAEISSLGKVLGEVAERDFFGETSLLRRPESILAGVRPPVYKRTATAMTDCIIHTLSAESFADVCVRRPAIAKFSAPYVAAMNHFNVQDTAGSGDGAEDAAEQVPRDLENIHTQVEDMSSRMDQIEFKINTNYKETMEMLDQLATRK